MTYREFWLGVSRGLEAECPAFREAMGWLSEPSKVEFVQIDDLPLPHHDPRLPPLSDEMRIVAITPWGFVFEPRHASDPGV